MLELLKKELYREYIRFEKVFKDHWEPDSYEKKDFYSMIELLRSPGSSSVLMEPALRDLIHAVKWYYQNAPILLIDEYDQPIMSSYEYENVQKKYDGYHFGDVEMNNPWSILNYADTGSLDSYWIYTSSNYLVKQALKEADRKFWEDFEQLVSGQEVPVWLTLETAYVERDSNYS